MTNKTFKELCKELKKAQKVRARAIKEKNSDLEEKANAKIDTIIAEMKQNKDYFVKQTPRDIAKMTDVYNNYEKIYKDYEKYDDKEVVIDNAFNADITSDAHINKILGKKDKKVAIIAASLIGVLGLSTLSGIIYKKGHKEDEDKDYTNEYTTEYTTEESTEEYVNNNSNVEVEYTEESEYEEKGTTTIRFKSDDSEYKNNESNTNNTSNTASNTKTDANKSINTNNNKTTENKNNNKTTNDNNKNSDTNTKDNKNNKYTFTDETKDTVTEETTETNTNNNSNSKEDYIIPATEQHTETVTEEPAPAVPDNMPIEEDENDVIYYDINGNETTKEEADKSFEQSNIISKETPKVETPAETLKTENNTDSKVISEKTTEINGEKHTEIIIEEAAPEVPKDMPVEEETIDSSLLNEYKEIKAQLEETKALLEEQEQSNDNAMSLSL